LLAVVFIAFGWQVRAKGRDWLWSSEMTSRAVATIVNAAGPGCRGAHVFFATAPVRANGVYANINAEGLAALGQCHPASVATLVRLGHDTPDVQAVVGPDEMTLTVERYTGGFVTSADLQHFTIGIEAGVPLAVNNTLGRLEAAWAGDALTLRQTFTRPPDPAARWFVFTAGRLEVMPPR